MGEVPRSENGGRGATRRVPSRTRRYDRYDQGIDQRAEREEFGK